MSDIIETLLLRNLQEVFGEGTRHADAPPSKRRLSAVACETIYAFIYRAAGVNTLDAQRIVLVGILTTAYSHAALG